MTAIFTQRLLREHGLSIKGYLAAKLPCSYSITRSGFRYCPETVQQYIENARIESGEINCY